MRNSSNSVSAWSRPSRSASSHGTISVAHTVANGSTRVRQVRGDRFADGNGPDRQARAARSLMPAAAAAAARLLPSIRFSRSRRTCASVTIRPPTNSLAQAGSDCRWTGKSNCRQTGNSNCRQSPRSSTTPAKVGFHSVTTPSRPHFRATVFGRSKTATNGMPPKATR